MTPQQEAAAELFDNRMQEATGYTLEQYERVRAVGPTSLAHVQLYGRLVDESGAVEAIEKWAAEDRKSNAGRKPHIPFRALLILHLMHTDAGSNRYHDVAKTLFARLTPETFTYLGITVTDGTQQEWYIRYWRSLNRLLALTSPWDVPRNTFLSAEAYRRALDTYNQERRDRMDELMNRLLHASVRRLPAAIRETYRGNIALDATLIPITGRPNPRVTNLDRERFNLDAMSGPYTRDGNHQGKGKRKDEAGWEAETVVTVPNAPGQSDSFPVLTTGITLHVPGKIKHAPLIVVKFHAQLFDERGYLMVDRAYNGLKPHRFQNPTRMMGFRNLYNFKYQKKATSGKQGAIEDAILVDGCLYVKWMPEALINASIDFKARRIDEDTYNARLAARTPYRLKEHGRPDHEGRQRFTYPDVSKLMCLDPATGKPVKPRLTSGSITLHPDSRESMTIIKNLQAHEFRSKKWTEWYHLRSHVEGNNRYVKDDAHANLGAADKRRPRGYAFQALAVGAAVAVSNMRRIVTFLTDAAKQVLTTKQLRARRRRDEHGNRLEHPSTATQLQM
ncbi:hypothetical protein J2Y46_000927 [Microbacterium sp. BE35]|uniref:hypothetical protein n=1 Tax=Microbacterium sp. BE35 TaxID=2817773 RepID=UPI00285C613C|nr:hypothetical protein [Microbacterium sp. BE35]MDR7188111.1 hypothetical protein [Microbacterium sp. BE35]